MSGQPFTSRASIEWAGEWNEQSGDDISPADYLRSLKHQCEVRQKALQTAQTLIAAYQKDNQALHSTLEQLTERISSLEVQNSALQRQESHIKKLQSNLLKYSHRVNQLIQEGQGKDRIIRQQQHKIDELEYELSEMQQRSKERQKAAARQQKYQRELEKQFQQGVGAMTKGVQSYSGEAREQKVLQWQLKQKDEEVMLLLGRLREVEGRLQSAEKEKKYNLTPYASTKLSKSRVDHTY